MKTPPAEIWWVDYRWVESQQGSSGRNQLFFQSREEAEEFLHSCYVSQYFVSGPTMWIESVWCSCADINGARWVPYEFAVTTALNPVLSSEANRVVHWVKPTSDEFAWEVGDKLPESSSVVRSTKDDDVEVPSAIPE